LISDLGNILILANGYVIDIYNSNYELKYKIKAKDIDFKLKLIKKNLNNYLLIFYLIYPTEVILFENSSSQNQVNERSKDIN
jgi:hypothetical protein